MSQSIQDLMRKAAELKPQRPPRGKYAKYLPLFQQMEEANHTDVSMAAFLVAEKAIPAANEKSCRRSINELLRRHAKTVPANTTSTPKLP